jgi:hypothetical protein
VKNAWLLLDTDRKIDHQLDAFLIVASCKVNSLMEGLTFTPENGNQVPERRSAGAVERDGLENRCGGNPTQGSNPCFSAMSLSNAI